MERCGRDALGADALFARGLDGLSDGHQQRRSRLTG
jgi:hypothetical protein